MKVTPWNQNRISLVEEKCLPNLFEGYFVAVVEGKRLMREQLVSSAFAKLREVYSQHKGLYRFPIWLRLEFCHEYHCLQMSHVISLKQKIYLAGKIC